MAALRLKLAACTLTLTTLTGCTPTTPTTPPPEPSPTCTPEAGGPPTPCTQYQHDQMIAKDKLYTQAEAVYRKFLAEDERIYRIGGVTEPTPVLLETTTGSFLTSSMAVYRSLKEANATAVGGEFTIAWFKRVPGESMNGSVVALKVCTDTSSVAMGAKGKATKPGLVDETIGYLAYEGSALKLVVAKYKSVIKC